MGGCGGEDLAHAGGMSRTQPLGRGEGGAAGVHLLSANRADVPLLDLSATVPRKI